MSDENTDRSEPEFPVLTNYPPPTKLGYVFGEVNDGLIILYSEYDSGKKYITNNKDLNDKFKVLFDYLWKTTNPIVNDKLLAGENQDDGFLIGHLKNVHKMLKDIVDAKDLMYIRDIKNTINYIIRTIENNISSSASR